MILHQALAKIYDETPKEKRKELYNKRVLIGYLYDYSTSNADEYDLVLKYKAILNCRNVFKNICELNSPYLAALVYKSTYYLLKDKMSQEEYIYLINATLYTIDRNTVIEPIKNKVNVCPIKVNKAIPKVSPLPIQIPPKPTLKHKTIKIESSNGFIKINESKNNSFTCNVKYNHSGDKISISNFNELVVVNVPSDWIVDLTIVSSNGGIGIKNVYVNKINISLTNTNLYISLDANHGDINGTIKGVNSSSLGIASNHKYLYENNVLINKGNGNNNINIKTRIKNGISIIK